MSLKKERHPIRTQSLEQYTVMKANKLLGFHLELLDNIKGNHLCADCQKECKGQRPTPCLKTV